MRLIIVFKSFNLPNPNKANESTKKEKIWYFTRQCIEKPLSSTDQQKREGKRDGKRKQYPNMLRQREMRKEEENIMGRKKGKQPQQLLRRIVISSLSRTHNLLNPTCSSSLPRSKQRGPQGIELLLSQLLLQRRHSWLRTSPFDHRHEEQFQEQPDLDMPLQNLVPS